MSARQRWPRNQVSRNRLKACQLIPFSSNPQLFETRGEPAIFKVAVETRRPSCRKEQQAGFAAVVTAEELRNLLVQVDASSKRVSTSLVQE